MADDLDSIVKGAPIAEAAASDANANANAKPGSGASPFSPSTGAGKPGDPLHHTPSSPSMIYLNLLILEASMRAQFLELRARKRHHTFFLAILTLWVAFFGYKLYFAPREDGRGVGGSIYWAVEGAQKVCFMGGIITAALVWATGIWDRGIRWPRRWFAISNRGLRGFNCKLVIIRQTWWAEALSTIGFFLTYGLFSHTASSSYRLVEPQLLRQVEKELQLTSDNHPTLVLPPDDDELGGHEEDLAPGGDYVKLLLLPKPFSPTFRENWELYRTEYWERENERRRLLRQKVKEHDRKVAKDQYDAPSPSSELGTQA
ncbi:spo7-like protein domain-containing protein [Trichoderma breve]|uniref:Spo7-like protein domain-containing protein n=1 Tax=Trichoderma breve TaxID=2034170 RepID=A0A9W9JRL2_9HYPO|nr:spo7-like protein domain-containing protein [Trichoderma breve]KAJ4864928.1 spo7-like protein domain-containing protein [Trichoderma breve]